MVYPCLALDDRGFARCRWEIEVKRYKTLSRAWFEVLEHALVSRVVRDYKLKFQCCYQRFTSFINRQNTSVIGQ